MGFFLQWYVIQLQAYVSFSLIHSDLLIEYLQKL